MSIYNKINAGFSLGTSEPVTSGIEDVIYIFNQDDVTLTYDVANPLIIKRHHSCCLSQSLQIRGYQQ